MLSAVRSVSPCTVETYDREQAKRVRRDVARRLRIDTKIKFCDLCDGFHVEAGLPGGRRGAKSIDSEILKKVALGLRYGEIARDHGVTYEFVRRSVERLQKQYGCISVPNLIATSIWLGIIKITDLMPTGGEHVS